MWSISWWEDGGNFVYDRIVFSVSNITLFVDKQKSGKKNTSSICTVPSCLISAMADSGNMRERIEGIENER